MTKRVDQIKKELKARVSPGKAAVLSRFFKTGKGEYGEGDQFMGVMVPQQREVAKRHKDLPLEEALELLESPIHEHRLTSLLILVAQFEKTDEKKRKAIYDFYYKHRKYVNNWDLVDLSCYKIVGAWLLDQKRDVLYELARSERLWDRRIAMVSCFVFIRKGEFDDALTLAEMLLHDEQDLIHKAVGWALREIGKKDADVLRAFLKKYHTEMPRVMYRYAIEKGVTEK